MKPRDAYMFPIIGSCVLFSLYVALKHLPSFIFEYGITIFFAIISVFAVQGMNDEIAKLFIPSMIFNQLNIELFTINIHYKLLFILPIIHKSIYLPIISCSTSNQSISEMKDNESDSILLTLLNVISLVLGGLVAGIWLFCEQHWLANNIIGISISIQAISFLNPGSFYTAFILLSLLFFYDIFWVFFTEVMVSVAKNLKAPIKLIFPRPAVSDKSNMLGLGDIVLPGIYIALLLRYDVKLCFADISNIINYDKYKVDIRNVSTFVFAVVCYCISLCVCLLIMFYFEHAQPALLYIVPGIILPVVFMTFVRGDFWRLWAFEEEDEKDKKE